MSSEIFILINSEGLYTKESLRAYKSLEAYNFFHSGHVRTVYYYETKDSSSKFAVLMAKVNPSQKSANNPHEAWFIVKKEDGTIMTGHYTCMAG